jgi:hypothetical protein
VEVDQQGTSLKQQVAQLEKQLVSSEAKAVNLGKSYETSVGLNTQLVDEFIALIKQTGGFPTDSP